MYGLCDRKTNYGVFIGIIERPSLDAPMPVIKNYMNNHLSGFYCDGEGASVLTTYHDLSRAIGICKETADALKAAVADGLAVREQEGYKDDPTAVAYFLHPNNFGLLLTEGEKQKFLLARYEMEREIRQAMAPRVISKTLGRPTTKRDGNRKRK